MKQEAILSVEDSIEIRIEVVFQGGDSDYKTRFEKGIANEGDRLALFDPSTQKKDVESILEGSELNEGDRGLAQRVRISFLKFLEDPTPDSPLAGTVTDAIVAFGLGNQLLESTNIKDSIPSTGVVKYSQVVAGRTLHTNPSSPHSTVIPTLRRRPGLGLRDKED